MKRLEEFFGIEEGEAGRGGRKHGEYMELDDDTGFGWYMCVDFHFILFQVL